MYTVYYMLVHGAESTRVFVFWHAFRFDFNVPKPFIILPL